MRCDDGYWVTGLQVRYARLEAGDRDMYDFRPRCGAAWQAWLGMRFPATDAADHTQIEAAVCQGMGSVTGVQVMRGRNERRDWDYYNFKLRCGRQWSGQPLGLAFDGLRETRSATCPAGAVRPLIRPPPFLHSVHSSALRCSSQAVAGLRVHRGFQDWGDVDTYEFQLYCADGGGSGGGRWDAAEGGEASAADGVLPRQPARRGVRERSDGWDGTSREALGKAASVGVGVDAAEKERKRDGRGGKERKANGEKRGKVDKGTKGAKGDKGAKGGKGGKGDKSAKGGKGKAKAGAFGSRAAEADAAAAEVRREMQRDAERRAAALKDEL